MREERMSQRIEIPVTGMTCAACAARVQKGLSKAPGVVDAAVNFATERATVAYDPASASAASLVAAVKQSGYGARVEETELRIEGLEWAATGDPVERALLALPQDVGVLHGDLHHGNVLDFGDGWRAIDPKGLVGERWPLELLLNAGPGVTGGNPQAPS